MRKITVNDFSGGIQEATAPDDFTDRQWAQLKGFVSSSETLFETQWGIQTIGTSATGFQAVFPLASSAGDYLVGLKTDGTIWWCQVPAQNAGYVTTNAATWTQITSAANVGWASGNSTTQPALLVQRNPFYRFLCAVPFEVQKYVRTPKPGDLDNVSKDEDTSNIARGLASAVLINCQDTVSFGSVISRSRAGNVATIETSAPHPFKVNDQILIRSALPGSETYEGWRVVTGVTSTTYSFANTGVDESPTLATAWTVTTRSQALIAYVDSSNNTVKIAVFPNVRRLPTHSENGDFISANYLDFSGNEKTETMPAWPTALTTNYADADSGPDVSRHPFTYIDKNATLLPGTGIIPEAQVGTVKGSTLILGNIDWRTRYGTAAVAKESVPCVNSSGSTEFGVLSTQVNLPTEVPSYARVLYNEGPGVVYLSDGSGLTVEIVSKAASAGTATLTTSSAHGFSSGDRVEIFNVEGRFDGVYTLISGTSGTSLVYKIASNDTVSTTKLVSKIVAKSISGTTATVKTSVAHGVTTGQTVQISNAGFPWDVLSATATAPDATTITYTLAAAPGDVAELAVVTDVSAYPRATKFKYRVEVGAYQTIPNQDTIANTWVNIYGAASASKTVIKAARNLNVANHFLNDRSTGPFRGGIYFSAGELDTFDPRAVLVPAKTDVRIAGLHMLDDTLIIITQRGSAEDGVIRLRGYLSRLISYTGTSDPNAVRIELIRGGLGAAPSTSTGHRYYSCVWSEAGVVVFVDASGGVYYTNGQACDRLDRYGPKPPAPSQVTDLDHVAAMGRNLFVYRTYENAPRLLCFTIMGSDGAAGSGCWTELNIPGAISNMVGTEDALYWIYNGRVQRLNPSAPSTERGDIDGVATTLTVSTRTFGDVGSHRRLTWHRFGMTFNTPNECRVKVVKVYSTGALNVVSNNPPYPNVMYSLTLNRDYMNPGLLGEFTVPAGIGPQAVASATVTFEGYVQLQSASFWVSGDDSRWTKGQQPPPVMPL